MPPEFWDDEELRDALTRERHIGHAIRRYRHHPYHGHRPISVEIAARWFSISQPQLSRIEKGRPVENLGRLIQWAKILRIPQDLLWFTLPVEKLNEISLEYGESYLTTAPSDLLKPLMVDIIGLQSALQRNSSVIFHRDLMSVAALLSVFTAQTLMNMGQVHEARRWWRTAKNSADRSGDPYSILWVRAREINIESFVYSRLGHLEKTESANEAALGLQDSDNMRWLASDGMKLSLCLVRKGDITEGLRHAQTVLTQLPEQHRAQYLVSDAHELVRSIPASGNQLTAARDYREWLNSL